MNAPQRPHEAPVPSALGPWILGAQIGQGGFGRVFRARHRITRKEAAVKVLSAHRARADQRERFLQEIGLLAEIDNMNVVRFYDADFTPDGLIWMAMELLQGATLAEHMAEVGRFSVEDAIQVAGDIADGLGAAHMIGVVHRDLKPQNVFITDRDVVKVLDFGISKLKNPTIVKHKAPTTDAQLIVGTFTHLAPEQLDNRGVDYRTDVFALGVILYQLLTDRHPFIEPDEPMPEPITLGLRILTMTARPVHEIVPSIPPDVWFALKKALEKDPARRYPSLVDFKRAIWDVRAEYLVRERLASAPLASLKRKSSANAAPAARPTAAPVTNVHGLKTTIKMQNAAPLALAKTEEEAIPAALVDEIARGITTPFAASPQAPAPLPPPPSSPLVAASPQEIAGEPRADESFLERQRRETARIQAEERARKARIDAIQMPTYESPRAPPVQSATPSRQQPPAIAVTAPPLLAPSTQVATPPRSSRQAPPPRYGIRGKEALAAIGVALALVLVAVPIGQALGILEIPGLRHKHASMDKQESQAPVATAAPDPTAPIATPQTDAAPPDEGAASMPSTSSALATASPRPSKSSARSSASKAQATAEPAPAPPTATPSPMFDRGGP